MTAYYELFFPKEALAIRRLLSTEAPPSVASGEGAALSVPHHMYSQQINDMLQQPLACPANCTVEQGLLVRDGDMSRSLVRTESADDCCSACAAQPVCIAWQLVQGEGCYLKSHLVAPVDALLANETLRDPRGVFGYFPRRVPLPLPRAIIMHGTTCIYQNDTIKFIKRDINTIWIGRFMIERPSLTRSIGIDEFSVSSCASMVDEVWVPTQWHRAAFEGIMRSQGFKTFPSIAVIEEAVDTELFSPDGDGGGEDKGARVVDSAHPFVFLSVFKWEYRKGWDVLLDGYWRAFSRDDPVELHVHTYLPATERGSANIYHHINTHARQHFGVGMTELPRVVWVNSVLNVSSANNALPEAAALTEHALVKSQGTLRRYSRMDMRAMLAAADAFVLPTRGEGWGLPIAEAMAMAMPVIVTNCSGILAYGREDNAFLIPVAPEPDDLGFAQPNPVALRGIMRRVLDLAVAAPSGSPEPAVDGASVAAAVNIGNTTAHGPLRAKGLRARQKMQDISPQSVVAAIEARLRYLASMRGWKL